MTYKITSSITSVFHRIYKIFFSPQKTWEEIAKEEEDCRDVQKHFLYPLFIILTLCMIVRLVDVIWYGQSDVKVHIANTLIRFVGCTIGFYVSVMIRASLSNIKVFRLKENGRINRYWNKLAFYIEDMCAPLHNSEKYKSYEWTFLFMAYAETFYFISQILLSIMPLLAIIVYVANIYTIILIWYGTLAFSNQETSDQTDSHRLLKFTITTTLVIYFLPGCMEWIINIII